MSASLFATRKRPSSESHRRPRPRVDGVDVEVGVGDGWQDEASRNLEQLHHFPGHLFGPPRQAATVRILGYGDEQRTFRGCRPGAGASCVTPSELRSRSRSAAF